MFWFLLWCWFDFLTGLLIKNFEDTLFMIFANFFSLEDSFDFLRVGLLSVLGIDLLFLLQAADLLEFLDKFAHELNISRTELIIGT